MIKVVYAEGCSITAGAEHADWCMTQEGLEYSETTWAANIQKLCFPKAKYFPTARSSSSNNHIRRRAIFYLSELLKTYKGKEIVFLVQWTDINRREVRVNSITNTDRYGVYDDKDECLYTTILPIDLPGVSYFSNPNVDQRDRNQWLKQNNILKYFNEFNSSIANKESSMYDTLTEIETLRTFCKHHGITMYETLAFGELVGLYGPVITKDKFLIDLQKRVDIENTCHYNKQDGLHEGIYNWAERLKLAKGPGHHPLEDPHMAWARKVIAHYNIPRVNK